MPPCPSHLIKKEQKLTVALRIIANLLNIPSALAGITTQALATVAIGMLHLEVLAFSSIDLPTGDINVVGTDCTVDQNTRTFAVSAVC